MGDDYISRADEIFKNNPDLRKLSESTFQSLARLVRDYNPKNPIDIKVEDILSIKNKKDKHDMIISIEVIERVNNPRLLLKIMHKILEDDGKLVLTVTNNQNWMSRLVYLLTGRFPVFHENDTTGRTLPSFLWQIKLLIKDLFTIEKITYNRSIIPFIRLKIPLNNIIFGENIIFILRKKIKQ
jgi:SAM-dependent methyltransferase